MRISRLQVENLRCLVQTELEPGPGLNLVSGRNGAGKTSLLEAIHLLAYGRSFRGSVREGVLRAGETRLRVIAEVDSDRSGRSRIGLERGVRDWEARADGASLASLSQLYQRFAMVCFEPGSHALIGGASEQRRRFLDWGVFHVEPRFLPAWRRYQRALRQRNTLLKQVGCDPGALDPWDQELAIAGEELTVFRESYLHRLKPEVQRAAGQFLPELGVPEVAIHRGWNPQSGSLLDALQAQRRRDLALGHTSVGPHRADWTIGFAELPVRERFSRGQEKLTALSCVLGQARLFATDREEWPVVCLDDLASELDRAHLDLAFDALSSVPAQVWLTSTETLPLPQVWLAEARSFHVEQGVVQRLL